MAKFLRECSQDLDLSPQAKGSNIFLDYVTGRHGTIVEPEAARRLDDSVEGGTDEAMKEPPATGNREISN
jgi:hypothetical protein